MRIAYVSTDPGIPAFGTKGASIHVQEMLRAFQRLGHSVTLLCSRVDGPAPSDLAALRCRKLPLPDGADPEARATAALAANHVVAATLAQAGPFDLVYERHALFAHAAMEHAAWQGLPSVLEINAPLIEEQTRYRSVARVEDAVASARRALGAAGVVAAVSPPVAIYARSHGADPARVAVVSNGVDPARFPERSPPQGPFTVGFLGTLKPWHDTATLVDAFARLRRGAVADAQLLIVGDGPERRALEARLERHDVAEAARFTGAVPASEVPGCLARMHAACAPYRAGVPFYFSPLKLYEYMAAGVPVVASRVGHLADVIDEGRTGLLVAPDDVAALAAALGRLAAEPALRDRLRAAARKQVLGHHTWNRVAERVIALARSPAARKCA